MELGEKSIFERFRVRVGRNYFAEKLFGGLPGFWSFVYDIELINPALVLIVVSGWRLATPAGSERGSPPGQGGAPEAETTKQIAVGVALGNTDLERVACYLGRRCGSRILRGRWIAKKPDVVGLFGRLEAVPETLALAAVES